MAAIGGQDTNMTGPFSVDMLEQRAAEQRQRLLNSVTELRGSVRERLDVKRNAREKFVPAASAISLVSFLFGYGLAGFFTKN